jgi:hypothetical protein
MDELEEEGLDSATPERSDIAAIAASVRGADRRWEPSDAIDLASVSWKPDLVREEPRAVLHVHLADFLRPYMVKRLTEAWGAGYDVHVALPLSELYKDEVVLALARIDAQAATCDGDRITDSFKSILTLVTDRGIRYSPEFRRSAAQIALDMSRQPASAHIKGRRFEAVLLFLLGQIQDFRVVEHNYSTATEELDGVVQQGTTHGRVWGTLATPFILLEAKNWNDPVTQEVVSILLTKMRGKRGTCRIAVLCGANGFTSDARDQELRFSGDPAGLTIAFVGPEELDSWVQADDGDEYLEKLVRRAMLR